MDDEDGTLARPWLAFMVKAGAHDVDGVLELCHPEIAWETRWPGFESPFRGRDGVRRFFAAFEEAIADVRPRFRILREAGDHVLVETILSGHGRGSGARVEMSVFDIWTFRDRLLWRRQTFYARDEAIAALDRQHDANATADEALGQTADEIR
jgi:ketosteroid isomerase-like protein